MKQCLLGAGGAGRSFLAESHLVLQVSTGLDGTRTSVGISSHAPTGEAEFYGQRWFGVDTSMTGATDGDAVLAIKNRSTLASSDQLVNILGLTRTKDGMSVMTSPNFASLADRKLLKECRNELPTVTIFGFLLGATMSHAGSLADRLDL